MIERLAVSWEDAPFAIVAVLAWLSAFFVSCPQASAEFVSKAGVQITAVITSLGPVVGSIEDDDREFLEDDLEPCGLPGMRLVSPPSLSISQVTPPQSISLSVLTPAQCPLRC